MCHPQNGAPLMREPQKVTKEITRDADTEKSVHFIGKTEGWVLGTKMGPG